MELIDRTALLEKSYYRGRPATVNHPWGDGAEVVDVEDIEAMPTIDAAPVMHGWWEKDPDMKRGDGHIYDYRCSACHTPAHKGIYNNNDRLTKYCSECGAKMARRR